METQPNNITTIRQLHQQIATAIKQNRRNQNISAQQLADKTQKLGYPISRSQIANYETGRKRSLDIAELMIIAQALNTPALNLIFPHQHQTHAINTFIGTERSHARIQAIIGELDQLIGAATTGRGQLTATQPPAKS